MNRVIHMNTSCEQTNQSVFHTKNPTLRIIILAKYTILIGALMLISSSAVNSQTNEIKHLDGFVSAYQAYPEIPSGYLEAMAFVNTRWHHQIPTNQVLEGHQERPQTVGIMGLHQGDLGYHDQVSEAAKLLGVSTTEVRLSPEVNILATAAMIANHIKQAGMQRPSLEELMAVTSTMMGTPKKTKPSQIDDFITASHFYDMLLVLDKGHDDHGVFILDQNIQWPQAFSPDMLIKLKAPAVRLDQKNDEVTVPGLSVNPIDETYQSRILPNDSSQHKAASPDYGSANWIASPYHGTRTSAIDAVVVHTTQGSYAGTLNWFQNNPYSVSAHYVIRSSDGQVTQMVREYRRAHHIGIHNSSTLGIEHEGFVNNAAWYTTAMYNASADLTKHFCQAHNINCSSTYNGTAHNGVVVLSSGIKVKGHQHFSGQNHTDPGINWDWSRYHQLINGGGSANDQVLDDFEQSEGRFNSTPTYSGSTVGISTASFAERTDLIKRAGSYSEHIQLRDNPNTSSDWSVRFLSASGSSSNNPKLNKAGGRIGFWVLATGSGMQVAVSVDDNDGTERSDKIPLNANQWTYVEWKLDDSAEWNPWYNGNGILGSQVSLDAIWFFRNQTSFVVNMYIDDVQYRFEG